MKVKELIEQLKMLNQENDINLSLSDEYGIEYSGNITNLKKGNYGSDYIEGIFNN